MKITAVGILALWVTCAIGYFMNIWRLVQYFPLDFAAQGGEFVLRVVGIFVGPLGVILGFIPF
jgi:hypothetical protein